MTIQSCAIIILGASGDLAQRKLIPALNILFEQGRLAPNCLVVGSGRQAMSDESFRKRFDVSPLCRRQLFYHQATAGLKSFLKSKGDYSQVVVFFSLPPHTYIQAALQLIADGFGSECSVVLEKPIGYDFISARALNAEMVRHFSEDRIYRIDHYLAKEPVRNLLAFRFANALFEPLWNSRHIQSIQISSHEQATVGSRAAYFDRAGIIRDMVQNHLLQLLSLLLMDVPQSLDPAEIKKQKIKLLQTLTVKACFKYQYDGFKTGFGIAPDSTTETYAELRLNLNSERWGGVPVYLRAGKACNRTGTEIAVVFKPLAPSPYGMYGTVPSNRIIFKIQPAEGILIDLASRTPQTEHDLRNTTMRFCFRDYFDGKMAEAYQTLLCDVLQGDHSLFVSAAETEFAWLILEPVLSQKLAGTYPVGKPPVSALDIEWVDFERYGSVCSG